MRTIDFRSDTLTKPTEEMRKAMYNAEVGDDVYGEDPTINKLEKLASEIVGKESALFVPTGTMGNQLALLCHTDRGQEVILEDWAHIYRYEVGGLSFLAGLQARPIKSENGIMNPEDVRNAIVKDDDIHHSQTGLICMENTHNMAGGVVVPPSRMKEIFDIAKENNIPVHLDGARVFNAAVALGVDVKELTQYTDSLMFCLSKGLCSPVGSILAGEKKFIDKARRLRKMLGGGMRQGGILAAAGIISLTNMVERLSEDHTRIKELAEGLNKIKGVKINDETVQTNILMINVEDTPYSSNELVDKMKEEGILASSITNDIIRFVTHYYITDEDIEYTIEKLNQII
ncbi:low-specificity L-threonine aldolase [Clostridium sp. D2Q-11]|uniref:Low-specificity L-threonine aldolase n=1 Tax=Anaeromonas frigoriresistens TaxID=2683708 RepID=A0A942V1B4_9FIRM|nr:low-specificity L-threonine aldolase [Anaeromonas frigoriresistens]MBS4540061.1 low-specificity L-threonine aldolase [Anaeromonas frigoriresistens]